MTVGTIPPAPAPTTTQGSGSARVSGVDAVSSARAAPATATRASPMLRAAEMATAGAQTERARLCVGLAGAIGDGRRST